MNVHRKFQPDIFKTVGMTNRHKENRRLLYRFILLRTQLTVLQPFEKSHKINFANFIPII